MKSIFVPVGGSKSDEIVFATALALARPLKAHLRFFHVHVRAGSGAVYPQHLQFANGPGLRDALNRFDRQAQERSAASQEHVQDFCARAGIALSDVPSLVGTVTASWQEESASPAESIIRHARHNDCVVTARASGHNGLPRDFLEQLLVRTGRPAVIAGGSAPEAFDGTIMVGWRETPEAARAVAIAQPLLLKARKAIIVHVPEGDGEGIAGANELAQQLAWSGVNAEVKIVRPDGAKVQDLLARTAADIDASLMVMGAYGRSRLREFLFGGCTQSFIEDGDRSILLMN